MIHEADFDDSKFIEYRGHVENQITNDPIKRTWDEIPENVKNEFKKILKLPQNSN